MYANADRCAAGMTEMKRTSISCAEVRNFTPGLQQQNIAAQEQQCAHLDYRLLLIHHLHAKSKEVAGLGIVVAGCIVPLQGVIVKQLLCIVLGRDGKVRGRIVHQRVCYALSVSCVMPIACMDGIPLRWPALPLQTFLATAISRRPLVSLGAQGIRLLRGE